MRIRIIVCWLLLFSLEATAFDLKADGGKRWYKGNIHTHTLWSDGDAAPEVSVAWYCDHGYNFLGLSDHNILSDGSMVKPFPVTENGRLTPERVEQIKERFGDQWVNLAVQDGTQYMRLKTLPEIKEHFERPGEFLLIQAEEITSIFPAVHVNALNIQRVIPPINNVSPEAALHSAVETLEKQSMELSIPMLTSLNHPNFSSGVPVEALLDVPKLQFFEVYNGHPSVDNWGNEAKGFHPTDRIWDIVLSMRQRRGDGRILYGVGTDDTHDYFKRAIGESNSGRGWIQVLSDSLTPESIIAAMKDGSFYASTGVTLDSISFDGKKMTVAIEAEDGVTYTTKFFGTRKDFDPTSEPKLGEDGKPVAGASKVYSDEIGETLLETTENPAVYELNGDELYVRAKIISSKEQENPFKAGDLETAWTQPAIPGR
ncbi:MAG: hypothetical protein H6751_09185 [Candidatus Omnitrophica bacterium]|nr:hypothetical protein [Candidatus Omnitrophota bacterium]